MSKKESFRNKVEILKAQSKPILASKNLPPEARALIKSLLSLIGLITVFFLEKKTRKNSSNSGLPPSQDHGSNGNRNKGMPKNGGNRGGQVGNTRTVKEKETLSPPKCSGCGGSLKKAKVVDTEERTELDVVYEVTETTLTAETRECSKCGEQTKAVFPEGFDGNEQYGIGVKAIVINFLIFQMMSFQRVQEYLIEILGKCMSQSTMLKYIVRLGDFLEDWESEMKEKMIKEAKVIHTDETSMRVNKKNYWIHTYGFEDIVLQFIHPSRGVKAIEDIGIVPNYGGILIHDCWCPYFKYKNCDHALCLCHLLRELKFVEDSVGHRWATNLKKLLKEAIELLNKRKKKVLSKREYKRLQRRYRNILTRALSELPEFPDKASAQHTDAQNLWLRFDKYESEILMFARVHEVDPTNNRAERDLRMNKVKKKISGCFRTEKMAKYYCRIYSYLKTMRNKGYTPMEAIILALQGKIPA